MTVEPATPLSLTPARQAELRERRDVNLAAGRPPYAWTRLDVADITWLIAEHGWSTDETAGERVDLRQANLVRADLRGQRLRFAQFEGAILFGADLRGADCFYAHFTQADLRAVQAEGVQFTMARMRGARLNDAKLAHAILRQSWLAEADLAGAVLDGADLSGAHLDHADLHEASLKGTVLTWALLQEADLRGAILASADLRSAHLERALLDAADLHAANLEGAWCDQASCYGTNFRDADLRGVRFPGAQLAGAQLAGTRLAGVDLAGVDLSRLADRSDLATTPTGDERAAHWLRGPERVAALRGAADGLDLLAAALAPTERDSAIARRLRMRARFARTAAWRAAGTFVGQLRALGQSLATLFIGDGADPGRVALWAGVLLATMTTLLLTLPGTAHALDLGSALSLALTNFTTAGYGAFVGQTTGALPVLGAVESLLGDLLTALFIAAVIRRSR